MFHLYIHIKSINLKNEHYNVIKHNCPGDYLQRSNPIHSNAGKRNIYITVFIVGCCNSRS